MLEVIRRFIVASLWIVGGVISFAVVDNSSDKLLGYLTAVALLVGFHLVINWIFAGAKKKTPENRSPREPDF